MSLFQVNKPKSASKIMLESGKDLNEEVLSTLAHIAKMVGATLGPGGNPVVIERPEIGMKPIITKDGVTVIKHLGYESATRQLILEAVRDAASRTASEAGDGTTTATILAESICRGTEQAVSLSKRISPQKIVREMQALVPVILNKLNEYKVEPGQSAEQIVQFLSTVASVSANGDKDLANAVIAAFDIVGDEGNITIIEASGPSKYEVERISGYTVDTGYDESCKNFASGFLNDRTGTLVQLERPVVILFDGVLNDIYQIVEALNRIGAYFLEQKAEHKSVVLVAHGFSDSVLGDLHLNWNRGDFKVLPLITKPNALANSQTELLYDLQAYAGTPVFNPIDRPLANMNIDFMYKNNKVRQVEMSKFRTSIMVEEDMNFIGARVNELKLRLEKPDSQYAANDLQVRIGKLTSGIARLNIYGPSQGETREKRDRAEDAWMAVRGATKYGALPGGGFSLVRLSAALHATSSATKSPSQAAAAWILAEALVQPVRILYKNYGYSENEIEEQLGLLLASDKPYDLSEQAWVEKPYLLDSFPAVAEAIRNSVSIASMLGTLGGLIAFKRDYDADKEEEKFVRRFEQGAGLRNVE